jgi:hypothetical protein
MKYKILLLAILVLFSEKSYAQEMTKVKYYVAPVEFSNGATSNQLTELIKKVFSQPNQYIECCTEVPEKADFVLIPSVPKVQIKNEKSKARVIQITMSLNERNVKNNNSVAQSKQALNLIKDKADDQKIAKEMLEKGFNEMASLIYNRMKQRIEMNAAAKNLPVSSATEKNDENAQ